MIDFGEFLRKELKRRGWSMAELARHIDYNSCTVQTWVHGYCEPRWVAFNEVMEALGYEIVIRRKRDN